MTFIETLINNWEVIVFLGGGLVNIGYSFSAIKSYKIKNDEDIRALKEKAEVLERKVEITQSDFSEIRGDIKSINAKLDLLINNKIK